MAAEKSTKQQENGTYRMKKKMQERILEQTKPGTILRNHPDYKAIMALVKKGE